MPKICRFTAEGRYTAKVDAAAETLTADNPMGMPLEDMSRVYVGDVDIDTHYHDLTTGQPVLMPTRPSLDHQFDYASKTWIDPRTLQDFKDAKWALIKAARDAAMYAPLVTPYGTFDGTAEAQLNIGQTVLLANNMAALGITDPIRYTLADNTRPSFTAAQIVEVGFAMAARVQAARNAADLLREQINAATTAAQLNLIHWI